MSGSSLPPTLADMEEPLSLPRKTPVTPVINVDSSVKLSGPSLPPSRDKLGGPRSIRRRTIPSGSHAEYYANHSRNSMGRKGRLSAENSRKVVSYLRRRLHERQRLWMNEKKVSEVKQMTISRQIHVPERKPVAFNLYSRYTDIGSPVSTSRHTADDTRETQKHKKSFKVVATEAPRQGRADINEEDVCMSEKKIESLPKITGNKADSVVGYDVSPSALSTFNNDDTRLPRIHHLPNASISSSARLFSRRDTARVGIVTLKDPRSYTPANTLTNDLKDTNHSLVSLVLNDNDVPPKYPLIHRSCLDEQFAKPQGGSTADPEENHENTSGENDCIVLDINVESDPGTDYGRSKGESETLSAEQVIAGEISGIVPIEKNLIMVYVSSTLSDMESERTVLMSKVFLKGLRPFCRDLGYELHVVDSHWGLKDVWIDDHSHADMCVDLIGSSKIHSSVNLFLMMVGQKLGYQPLPRSLTVDEFTTIMDTIRKEKESLGSYGNPNELSVGGDSGKDDTLSNSSHRLSVVSPRARRRSSSYGNPHEDYDVMMQRAAEMECDENAEIMQTWYKLDENNVPPAYVLQNISSKLPGFMSPDKIKKQRAKNQWALIYKHLQEVISTYLPENVIGRRRRSEISETLPEKELKAAGNCSLTESDSMCFLSRSIPDVRKNLSDFAAKDYVDLLHMKPEVDDVSYGRVQALKYQTIPSVIKQNNIRELSVRWHKDGISAQSDRTHALYLDNLTRTCGDMLMTMIERCHEKKLRKGALPNDDLYEEVAQHAVFAQQRCKEFYGREEILSEMKAYILSDARQPMILYGESGMGKSSLIAKSIELVQEWTKPKSTCIIYRFIGATPASEDLHSVLRSVCRQICILYGLDQTTISKDFYGLTNDLEARLAETSPKKSLVLLVDGIDELWGAGGDLDWIPKILPEHVKLVLSTGNGAECKVLAKMKKNNPDAVYTGLPPLERHEIESMVRNLLARKNRTLTASQESAVMKMCQNNPNTLFIKLVLEEAQTWMSFAEERETVLPCDLQKLLNARYAQLEGRHGEPLVRRALGYITAAEHGVSRSELEDLLSLDDKVMATIIEQHATRLRRFPPGLLCRLLKDLDPLLSLVKIDSVWLYRWSHQQYKCVSTERYIKNRDRGASYHRVMAEYFMGEWAGKRKPFPGNDNGSDRFVADQPLHWGTRQNDGSDLMYNLRKLKELPSHLFKSNQLPVLKQSLLFNFEWTLAKLKAFSLDEITSDLQITIRAEPKDHELRFLSDVLVLSAVALDEDPNQLASQLTGRLSRVVMEDKPKSVWETQKFPLLAQMLDQANMPSVPSLVPSVSCLAQPGGILYDLLGGHSDNITAVCVSVDGTVAATASKDDSVRLWDLKTRRVIKTLHGTGRDVTDIHLYLDSDIVAVVRSNTVKVYTCSDGSVVTVIDDFIDPVTITSAGKLRQYLVAFFSGSNVIRVWDLSRGSKMILERAFSQKGIHRDASLCVSLQSHEDKVLYAFRSSSTAHVINVSTGKKILNLTPPNPGGSVTALGISSDSYIIACRYSYMTVSEIHQLELFDIQSGVHTRSIKGCTTDVVRELYVNKTSTHVMCISPSIKSNSSTIAVWNLDTDEHKHMAKHPKLSFFAACSDLTFFLTASATDKVLRIWNIRKQVNKRHPVEGKLGSSRQGICQLIPMVNNPRYVVAKTHNNGPISVWNVVKSRCAGSAVRIERGLTNVLDVVLVRNDKVVILSDRRELTDDDVAVYQTIYIYSVKTKKFVRKVSDTFIVPSPSHEYHLLEDELLMGLSESRDHLIVWSLENGRIKFRIRRSNDSKGGRASLDDTGRIEKRETRLDTVLQTPWDIRSESEEARERRERRTLEEERRKAEECRQEKDNPIKEYRLSRDESVVVCSYFAHHFNVFQVSTQAHLHTLEMVDSIMYLYISKLTNTGSHIAHVNYNDIEKTSYITLWDLTRGMIKKRLKKEPNVCCIGMNESANRVVFGNEKNILKVWDIRGRHSSLSKLRAPSEHFVLNSSSKIFMMEDGGKALIFSRDLLLFNLDDGTHIATFTPDLQVSCIDVVFESQLIVMALNESSDVITLRLKGKNIKPLDVDLQNGEQGEELFGETTGDSTEEEDSTEESDTEAE